MMAVEQALLTRGKRWCVCCWCAEVEVVVKGQEGGARWEPTRQLGQGMTAAKDSIQQVQK